MAISYKLDNRLHVLNGLLAEYQGWFAAVSQAGCYGGDLPEEPQSFKKWIGTLSIDGFNIDGQYGKQKQALIKLHEELMGAAKASLDQETHKAFASAFQSFITQLQGFSQAVILEEWGLDILTGLKNNVVLKRDLSIELERLSREGHPFCVGLVRIDDFENIDAGLEQGNKIIKSVAGYVTKCLRSYDEGYRISRNHFVLCLKQSDIGGGRKALMRLTDILEDSKETYMHDGKQKLLSVSSCVASPIPGDDMDQLIDDLHDNLKTEATDTGEVLAHREMSPLERMVRKDSDES
ncbi:MAG: diguanylate cyclase [Pseudomonadota bacterium]